MRSLAILLLLVLAAPAAASLSPADLAAAVARPPAHAALPGRLGFVDQRGSATTLAAAAGGKPTVLMFVDYTCKHICGPGLTLTAGALHDSGLTAGRDVALVAVGIDPNDSVADARVMAAERLAAVPDVARAAVLLTGDAPTIAKATRALGYGYAYDAGNDQFAHDASLYVFAPDGHLATLLPELALGPEMIRAAVRTAGTSQPAPGLVQQVAHLCYGFAAAHGIYGGAIVWALQGMAVLLLGAAGVFFWSRWRRRRLA